MLKNENYLLQQREKISLAILKIDRAKSLLEEAGLAMMDLDHFRFHSQVIDSQVDTLIAMIDQLENRQNYIEQEMKELDCE